MTNGFDWFIPCAMNANEISPKANPRLNRIKIVSRIARFVILAMFLFFVGQIIIGEQSSHSFSSLVDLLAAVSVGVPKYFPPLVLFNNFIIQLGIVITLSVWYWKLAKLFYFYEQGLIFAGKTIRCLKTLGLLCVIGWILICIRSYMTRLEYQLLNQAGWRTPPPHLLHDIDFRGSGFFYFDFGTGIDFGLLLAGVIIVLIAWIMDEGRKIQEEQELTV